MSVAGPADIDATNPPPMQFPYIWGSSLVCSENSKIIQSVCSEETELSHDIEVILTSLREAKKRKQDILLFAGDLVILKEKLVIFNHVPSYLLLQIYNSL